MKFSDCVNEFAALWPEWIAHNNIAISSDYPYATRREHAIKAERLLNKRYKLVQQIDTFFKQFEQEFKE
jgi:hypothetical protein|tara:strand:- start:1082 stop:1288 length:207 start_codon:yes stop_codon:yes gene_type:complete